MKKSFIKCFAVLFASLSIIGCDGSKQQIGTGAGVLVGGLIGSQFGKGGGQIVGTLIGAGAGALIGNSIGKHLDDKDKEIMAHRSQYALEESPSGRAVAWKNPDSGRSGTITPTKTYQDHSGKYCREYTQAVFIGGKEERAYGKACRQKDGAWQIISE
jgi:surface antigen